jgi:predicted HicB family RNase H-like nuclease
VPSPAEDRTAAYRISLVRTRDGAQGSWLAEVDELSDCSARGATPVEAMQRAWAAIESATATDAGAPSAAEPEQKTAAKHSGKLLVRMPATLHDELARAAESEGVSLNQMITGILASAVEWRSEGRHPQSATVPRERGLPGRLTGVALAANLVAVAVAAAVAITLLVLAWRAGI